MDDLPLSTLRSAALVAAFSDEEIDLIRDSLKMYQNIADHMPLPSQNRWRLLPELIAQMRRATADRRNLDAMRWSVSIKVGAK